MIIGLAPGVRGANRTGRPFTGDYAGDLLFETLARFGLAKGAYCARPDDGLTLVGCRIVNALRCVPPLNKPLPKELAACRPYLIAELQRVPDVLIALGRIAHEQLLRAFGLRLADYPFVHGAEHRLGDAIMIDSYHCSRYNTNTGRLTAEMFAQVFTQALSHQPKVHQR